MFLGFLRFRHMFSYVNGLNCSYIFSSVLLEFCRMWELLWKNVKRNWPIDQINVKYRSMLHVGETVIPCVHEDESLGLGDSIECYAFSGTDGCYSTVALSRGHKRLKNSNQSDFSKLRNVKNAWYRFDDVCKEWMGGEFLTSLAILLRDFVSC